MLETSRGALVFLLIGLPAAHGAQESAQVFDVPAIVGNNYERFEDLIDLDQDGDLDLIGWWYEGEFLKQVTFKARFNDGGGVFAAGWSHTIDIVLIGTTQFETCNLNGDALPDFVYRNRDRLWFFTGNGQAAPTPYTTHQLPSNSNNFVVADFDADGLDDMACHGNLGEIWLNQGPDAPLLQSDAFPLGTGPINAALTVCEANGDGLPDLVLDNSGPGPGLQFRFVEDGRTLAGMSFAMTKSPAQSMLVPGDVDGDGDEDLVVFWSDGQHALFRRVGPAAYALESIQAGGPATELADVDGDGFLDGVCCAGSSPGQPVNGSASRFEVSLNDGTGRFAPPFQIPSLGSEHIAGAADVDADGDVDLVGGRCVVYARGAVTPPSGQVLDGPTPTGFLGTAYHDSDTSDFDSDGDPDFGFGDRGVLRNDGAGGLALETFGSAGFGIVGPGFAGDWDGDGDPDLLVGLYDGFVPQHMVLLENNGSGKLTDSGPATPPGVHMSLHDGFPDWPSMWAVGSVVSDLDDDGDLDLIVRRENASGSYAEVFLNDGSAFFEPGAILDSERIVRAVDLDGDGWLDLVGRSDEYWRLHLASGPGQYQAGVDLFQGDFGNSTRGGIGILDFDGDADLDLIAQRAGYLVLMLNDGSGQFTEQQGALIVESPLGTLIKVAAHPNLDHYLVQGDVNLDGIDDLVAGPLLGCDDGSYVLLMDGQGGFSVRVELLQASALADLDGDGDLDAIGPRTALGATFPSPGSGKRVQYGTPGPAACSALPVLGATGPFRVGHTTTLRVSGVTAGSFGFITVGTTQTALTDFPWPGVSAWAWPPLVVLYMPGPVGAGTLPGDGITTLSFTVQPDFAFYGDLYHQAFFVDLCAPDFVTGSNGLNLRYGF